MGYFWDDFELIQDKDESAGEGEAQEVFSKEHKKLLAHLLGRSIEGLADGELRQLVMTLPDGSKLAARASEELSRRGQSEATGRSKRETKKTRKVRDEEEASKPSKQKQEKKKNERKHEHHKSAAEGDKKAVEAAEKERKEALEAAEEQKRIRELEAREKETELKRQALEATNRANEAANRTNSGPPPGLQDSTGYAFPAPRVPQVVSDHVQNREGPVRRRGGGSGGQPFSQPLAGMTFNFSSGNRETLAAVRRVPVSSAQQTDVDRRTALDEEVARAAQQEEWAQEYHHGTSGQDEAVALAAQRMEWQRDGGHTAIEGDVDVEGENPVEPGQAAHRPEKTSHQRPTNAPGGLPPPGYRPYQQQNIPAHHRTLSNALTWAPPNSNVFNLSHIWHTFELLRLSQNILQYHRPSVRQRPNAAAHIEDAMMPLRWFMQRHGHDTYLATAPTNWDVRTLVPYAADTNPYAADTNARPRHAGNLRSTIVQLRVAVWVMRNYNGTAGRNELSDEESVEMEVALRDLEEFLGYLE